MVLIVQYNWNKKFLSSETEFMCSAIKLTTLFSQQKWKATKTWKSEPSG